LNNTMTNTTAQYSIDDTGANIAVAPNSVTSTILQGFFLDGTLLRLVDPTNVTTFQYAEILHGAKSFDFVLGTWRGEKLLGRTGPQHPDAIDLQLAPNAFLTDCTDNSHRNNGVTRQAVISSMIQYMSIFVYWRDSYSPTNYSSSSSYLSTLNTAQDDLAQGSNPGHGATGDLIAK